MKVKKYKKEIEIIVNDLKAHYKKYGIKNIKYIETVNFYNCRRHIFDCILDGKKQRIFVDNSKGLISVKVFECIDLNKYLNEFGLTKALEILTNKFK